MNKTRSFPFSNHGLRVHINSSIILKFLKIPSFVFLILILKYMMVIYDFTMLYVIIIITILSISLLFILTNICSASQPSRRAMDEPILKAKHFLPSNELPPYPLP